MEKEADSRAKFKHARTPACNLKKEYFQCESLQHTLIPSFHPDKQIKLYGKTDDGIFHFRF